MSILKKVSITAILSIILFVGLNPSTIFAAAIGDPLPNPEEGWTRYLSTSEIFTYDDSWAFSKESNGLTYSGAWTNKSGKLAFEFQGTKIRFLTSINYSYSKQVAIEIDGNIEYFSPKNDAVRTYNSNMLSYEKVGLENTNHTVKVWTVEPSTNTLGYDYRFYGIDVYEEFKEPNPEPQPEPSADRAILTITMTTGLEKEFDLSMNEVNSFLNWYDAKENGTGPAKYGIDKQTNNKGPFSKRVDYVIFKNILSFEVDEYTLNK